VRPCVIDWSNRVERAEAKLWYAVIRTLINTSLTISLEGIAEVIATELNLDRASIVQCRTDQDKFLLFVEDRLMPPVWPADSSPLAKVPSTFTAVARPAKRLTLVFPSLLEVELSGIPADGWEVSMAKNRLNPYGWIEEIHPSTRNREDYSSFRGSAWCFLPELIPGEQDLIVIQPRVAFVKRPPVKRGLVYLVKIVVNPTSNSARPPPDEDDSDHPGRR
jgi:hypothetical protein